MWGIVLPRAHSSLPYTLPYGVTITHARAFVQREFWRVTTPRNTVGYSAVVGQGWPGHAGEVLLHAQLHSCIIPARRTIAMVLHASVLGVHCSYKLC